MNKLYLCHLSSFIFFYNWLINLFVQKDKQLEEIQQIDKSFQKIKEEEDKKIKENQRNEIREQEILK